MHTKLLLIAMFFILGLNVTDSISGGEPWRDDTSALPQYCKDRVHGTKSPQWEKWRRVFGDVHIHIHHYCFGVWSQQKARTSLENREKMLGLVTSQMRYVGNHCKQGCVLYPELHNRWGWALEEQGKFAEAIEHYLLAIEAKPDYTTAYAGLSDLYIKLEMTDEARKILKAGLKSSPGSRKLERRLQEINNTD